MFLRLVCVSILLFCVLGVEGVGASGPGFPDDETPADGKEATFLLVPSVGNYKKNEQFTVQLQVNTTKAATSLKAYLVFDASLLQVKNIDVNKESFPYWWENKTENGTVKLLASVPNPGISGQARVATITFQVLRSGTGAISYDVSSSVLTPSDQNILDISSSSGARFVLVDDGTSGADSPSPQEKSGNSLSLILGIIGLLGIGVVIFLIWKKLRTGNQNSQ